MTSTSSPSAAAAARDGSRAQEEARAAVLASLRSVGAHYDAQFQRRATDLHANATTIAKQEAQLKQHAAALAQESAKWQQELDRATTGVKECGDVQNWAEMMERDLLVLEETLRQAEGRERIESASGGSSWRTR